MPDVLPLAQLGDSRLDAALHPTRALQAVADDPHAVAAKFGVVFSQTDRH